MHLRALTPEHGTEIRSLAAAVVVG